MRLPRAPFAALALVALAAGLLVPSGGPASADPSGSPNTGQQHRSDRAEEMLRYTQGLLEQKDPADAEAMLESKDAVGGYGAARSTGNQFATDPTIALRDLALAKEDLTGSERRQAERLLARPAYNRTRCADGPPVCVHWTTSGKHRATSAFAGFTLKQVRNVFKTYLNAGYRRPKQDGNKYVDVYLRDVASQGFYGYCATSGSAKQTPAYCVLDNDYAKSQYPRNSPKENLRVTAAHEFFHAVQFNYDSHESVWLMEATATWAEEHVYDWINDNRQYLRYGQLRKPGTPLSQNTGLAPYGNWIYFEYLTRKERASQGGLPVIVRDIWRRTPSQSAVNSVRKTLSAKGRDFERLYGLFAAGNQHPGRVYPEGGAYGAAPRVGEKMWKSSRARSGTWWSVDHLSSRAVRIVAKNTPAGRKLRISATVPAGTASRAFVTTYRADGSIRVEDLAFGRDGKASETFGFGANSVRSVELVMANAEPYASGGDGKRFSWSATAVS